MSIMVDQGGVLAGQRVATRRVLRDEVFDALFEQVVGGEFAAGETLGIDPLAARLGVSPTPVREALVQLEATGLVVRTALRGYRVAPPMSREELEQLFTARRLIEVGAARMATRRSDALVPILEERHAAHEAMAERLGGLPLRDTSTGQLRDYLKVDWTFHTAIFAATQNSFIMSMAQHLSTHGQRMHQFVEAQHHDAQSAVAEHHRILEAFRARDADSVERAVGEHIDAVRLRALSDLPS